MRISGGAGKAEWEGRVGVRNGEAGPRDWEAGPGDGGVVPVFIEIYSSVMES